MVGKSTLLKVGTGVPAFLFYLLAGNKHDQGGNAMNHLTTERDAYNRPHYDACFDKNGILHVKNFSAWCIPNLSIERAIRGTVYTVTGSFEGDE